jgi:hypothetical protein
MELCYNDVSEIDENFNEYNLNTDYYDYKENDEEFSLQETPDLYNIDYNLHIIEWIHEFIMNCNFEFTRIDMNTNIIYNNVIDRLKEITNKYFEIKEDIDYHSLHYLYNPEDFFDEIFYCRGQNKFWFKKYNEAKELLDKFELMSYTIFNYNAEKEFENQ